jgi:transcriptional/translational regulatory protein YebC/TACO1
MFAHKAIFAISKSAVADRDEFELEMIDAGLEEIREEEDQYLLSAAFSDFGTLNKALEDRGIEIQESKFEREPAMMKKLTDEEVEDVIKLIEKMEEDDDVQNVFHTMDMSE